MGIVTAIKLMIGEGEWDWAGLLIGIIAGGLGGCAMWFIDAPECDGPPATRFGSILAVLAASICIIPVLALIFAVPAFLANRDKSGWQNQVSRIVVGLNCAVSAVVIWAFVTPLR